MKHIVLFVTFLFTVSSFTFSQKEVSLLSPDGNLKFVLILLPDAPVYQVSYKKQVLIENSSLGFDFDNGPFAANLKIIKTTGRTIDETYDLVVGKVKTVRSHSKERVIEFEEKEKPFRKINLVIRAFNDGLAFRYEFPEQTNWKSYQMYDENTTFILKGNPRVLAMTYGGFYSGEGRYTYEDYDKFPEDRLLNTPAMFVYPDGTHMVIADAAIRDYSAMYLKREGQKLTGRLSPLWGQEKIRIKADLPHRTPWRVLMISDRAGTLIESNILTNLNEPCKIEDTSWLKPGKTTWNWWNGSLMPDTTFSPGNNFEFSKYYIDFASNSGLEYHSVIGFLEMPWYVDDGFLACCPGKNVDVTKSISTLDMKAICDYAKNKGVDIRVWVHWKPFYDKLDEALDQYEKWGITGMMVDFIDSENQEMMRIQEEILEKAAKHHMHIQWHGGSKPSGMHRTYPNEFTSENTFNYEKYKDGLNVHADHDISIPFTRLLAGATDYHLGGFRAVPRSEFKVQFTNTLVTSTRCHMLAMYVVLESYLTMVCDYPKAYIGQPGFEFIQKVPTSWDETRAPHASVNEYVTIARRKGDDWYIGSITNSTARTVQLSLDFLEKGQRYIAEIYTDATDVNINPNHLVKQLKDVTKEDIISLSLASEGGAVMHIYKKSD